MSGIIQNGVSTPEVFSRSKDVILPLHKQSKLESKLECLDVEITDKVEKYQAVLKTKNSTLLKFLLFHHIFLRIFHTVNLNVLKSVCYTGKNDCDSFCYG